MATPQGKVVIRLVQDASPEDGLQKFEQEVSAVLNEGAFQLDRIEQWCFAYATAMVAIFVPVAAPMAMPGRRPPQLIQRPDGGVDQLLSQTKPAAVQMAREKTTSQVAEEVKEHFGRALISELFYYVPAVQEAFITTSVLQHMPAWAWLLEKHDYPNVLRAGRAVAEAEKANQARVEPTKNQPTEILVGPAERSNLAAAAELPPPWECLNCGKTYRVTVGRLPKDLQKDYCSSQCYMEAVKKGRVNPLGGLIPLGDNHPMVNMDAVRTALADAGVAYVNDRKIVEVPSQRGLGRYRVVGHSISFPDMESAAQWAAEHPLQSSDWRSDLVSMANHNLVMLARETTASKRREQIVMELFDRQDHGLVSEELNLLLNGLRHVDYISSTREQFVGEWDRLVAALLKQYPTFNFSV